MNQLALISLAIFFIVVLIAWCPPCVGFVAKIRGPEPTHMGFFEGFRNAYCEPGQVRLQQLPLADFHTQFAQKSPDFRLSA